MTLNKGENHLCLNNIALLLKLLIFYYPALKMRITAKSAIYIYTTCAFDIVPLGLESEGLW